MILAWASLFKPEFCKIYASFFMKTPEFRDTQMLCIFRLTYLF